MMLVTSRFFWHYRVRLSREPIFAAGSLQHAPVHRTESEKDLNPIAAAAVNRTTPTAITICLTARYFNIPHLQKKDNSDIYRQKWSAFISHGNDALGTESFTRWFTEIQSILHNTQWHIKSHSLPNTVSKSCEESLLSCRPHRQVMPYHLRDTTPAKGHVACIQWAMNTPFIWKLFL